MDYSRRSVTALVVACLVAGCSGSAPAPPVPSSSPTQQPTTNLAGAGSDGLGDPYYPTDGNGGYDVTNYNVSISYDPGTKKLDGDTTVTATATADLSQFNLDLTGLDVTSVEVDNAPAQFSRAGEHELVIKAPLTKGKQFRTRVRYNGTPIKAEDGQLGVNGWQQTKSGGAFVAGEPHSATFWFPANDHPRDKATFRLAARVPNGWTVISNGREEPSSEAGGWTTFHWAETTRLATYLTTIGIDKWTIERSTWAGGIPVVSAYAPGAQDKKQMEARLPEILDFLSSKFGPYPQSAAGGIYLNEEIGFSLETQGRPIYAKWTQFDTVVHENAHQWFGDSVSVDSWADICLNECFASYAQWLWAEAKEKENLDQRYRTGVDRGKNRDSFWGNKLHGMGSGNEFNGVYDKGVLAIHALRRQIGEDAFNRVLKEWPATHKDSNATWKQFEEFVQKIAGQDLRGFYDAWFHSDQKPADQYLYPGKLRP
ncbi:aminopeptidase N [Kibdelosporangium banguiense]|uniref:Aminopeptidase N n=1 Tax=Kibdelosporangium banguiense TaxID=1365924 RepID=A0ABS4TBG1_9PSEU|nr:M1 family metallopeptidase [Kibdelosporangium banguiense]MBP2321324.1 aminopeptidase N [Kibdelosporangium banguiense]